MPVVTRSMAARLAVVPEPPMDTVIRRGRKGKNENSFVEPERNIPIKIKKIQKPIFDLIPEESEGEENDNTLRELPAPAPLSVTPITILKPPVFCSSYSVTTPRNPKRMAPVREALLKPQELGESSKNAKLPPKLSKPKVMLPKSLMQNAEKNVSTASANVNQQEQSQRNYPQERRSLSPDMFASQIPNADRLILPIDKHPQSDNQEMGKEITLKKLKNEKTPNKGESSATAQRPPTTATKSSKLLNMATPVITQKTKSTPKRLSFDALTPNGDVHAENNYDITAFEDLDDTDIPIPYKYREHKQIPSWADKKLLELSLVKMVPNGHSNYVFPPPDPRLKLMKKAYQPLQN